MRECDVIVTDFRKALSAVHAEGEYPTLYSNILDPHELVMYLYLFHNFEEVITIDMKQEMEKGYHVIKMDTLFPSTFAYEIFLLNLENTLARFLQKIIDKDGLETALDEYKKLNQDKNADSYTINEYELNNLGYLYLNSGKFDEAIAIFTINVEQFPEHCNCYDSLGEAYMAADMKERAIQNYQKALEINPDFPSSRDALKKLMEK